LLRNIFVDRVDELEYLERLWREKSFALVIIYGRRRIGKTRLLLEFSKGRKTIYYLAVEATYEHLSREFSDIVEKTFGLPIGGDIISVLRAIPKIADDKGLVVLDEFQYLVDANPRFVSELQRLVDEYLARTKMMLILCGSAVSFFERKLLGYKSPIFGRRKAAMKIKPLRFVHIKEFFPKYTLKELIYVYGIVGGTPAYLEKLDSNRSILENIRDIITPGHYLYDEALNLLRQEVREPKTYFSILAAITEGYVRPGEIASFSKVDPRTITKYIDMLEDLDILTRVRPLGFKKPVIVEFSDNYFRFWFTYIYKLRTTLELGLIEEALEYVTETLDQYTSKIFERIIIELLPHLYRSKILKTKPIQFGRWWHKDIEIDLVIREPGKSTTFVETKWKDLTHSEALRILDELQKKSTKTGLQSPQNFYMLVARKITDKETPIVENHRIIIDLRTLEDIISK